MVVCFPKSWTVDMAAQPEIKIIINLINISIERWGETYVAISTVCNILQ